MKMYRIRDPEFIVTQPVRNKKSTFSGAPYDNV